MHPRLLLQIKKSWLILSNIPIYAHAYTLYNLYAILFRFACSTSRQNGAICAKNASVDEYCAAKRWRPALPCIHTPFLGKNKQHAEMDPKISTYCAWNSPRTKYKTNVRATYQQLVRRNPRVYMNIFNDAARPHRATWLSPFFVVIEFSKAMWHKKLLMISQKTSFRICTGRRHLV